MLDPNDPYSSLDPYRRLNAAPRQPSPVQPLAPQEEESVLGRIGSAALGGVGYAGSVLEKTFGGRAVRGLLGGRPRELLSIIPGSDTLGITDEKDRVSGKELLGFDPHDDSWGGMLGGMAAEMALDPASYLTFGAGALSKSGMVAKKLGALPSGAAGRVTGTLDSILQQAPHLQQAAEAAAGGAPKLAGMLNEPLGGLAGIGLPFRQPSMLLGQGQAGADFLTGAGNLAKGVDQGLRSIPFVGTQYGHAADLVDAAGRYGKALFHAPVMGATDHLGQETASEAHKLIAPYVADKRMALAGIGEQLKQAGVDPLGVEFRQLLEGVHPNAAAAHPALQAGAAQVRTHLDEARQMMERLGLTDFAPLADLEAQYAPRQMAPLAKGTPGYGQPRQPNIPADARVQGPRVDALRHIVGGTEGFNQAVLDPQMYQGNALQAAAYAAGKLSPKLPAADIPKHSLDLVNTIRGLDPQYQASIGTANPLRFFGNHPLADAETYFDRLGKLQAHGEATQNLLARTAEQGLPGKGPPPGARSLIQALEDVGMAHGQDAQLGKLIQQGHGPIAGLHDLYVPQSTIDTATRYLRPFSTPDAVSGPMNLLDRITGLTKAWQTAPFPSFHARNLASGAFQNLGEGGNAAPGGLLKQARDAYSLGKGGILQDANQVADLAHLSPEAATKTLAHEMYAWGIGGHRASLTREGVGPLGDTVQMGADLPGYLSRIPGESPRTVSGALSKTVPHSLAELNPLNEQTNSLIQGGRQMGDVVEGTNRGGLYLSLRRQGYTPEAAAKQVIGSHFDYTRGAKTDFEAKVMSRLVPFYSYARGNIPYQLEQIATRPSGLAGMTTRAAGSLRQQGGEQFLPDYLGSGLALPMGGEDAAGTKRFLTRLDLPPEQAFEMLKGGPHGAQNTLLGLLGQTNPLLKAPLEWATGKQFFTGRDLEDLYSQTGNTAMDQLIANSPVSRLATTARTLADPRKWETPLALPLNLATGAKVSDVDMPKQRSIAEREYVTGALRGLPEVNKFETLSVKPENLGNLTPEEFMLLRLNKTLEARAQQAARARQAAGQ